MNIEEYRDRIEKMHTVTGVPTYWEELQEVSAERDRWREAAHRLAKMVSSYGEYDGMSPSDVLTDAYNKASVDE
jgi:hypothetical protein